MGIGFETQPAERFYRLDGSVTGGCPSTAGLLAQCRRDLLLKNDAATHPPGRPPPIACEPPSLFISPSTMPAPNPSSAPNQPRPFSLNSTAVLYHPFDSVH